MKKSILFLMAICILFGNPVNAQVSRVLNKVTNPVTNDVTGEPEPKCACEQPELILDLGGKLKLMYSEITLSLKDDGSLLVKDIISNNFYIVKDGRTDGPIMAGDPRLAGFENANNGDVTKETNPWANNEYISNSGGKY